MSTYDKIWWLPICGGLTGLGLVLSYLTARARGLGPGMRVAAWSLLPIAAYLTGSIEMFWKMGVAVGDFAKGFVFSPKVWSGIAVAGLAVVLFVVSGPLRNRGGAKLPGGEGTRRRAPGRQERAAATGAAPSTALAPVAGLNVPATAATPEPLPQRAAKPAKGGKKGAGDDGIGGDVEDILRRHGIS